MDGLWSFANDFLRSFPEDVINRNAISCPQMEGIGQLSGITLKMIRFPSNTTGGVALRNFMNILEEEEQMMEVLDAVEEDFRDETYSCHDFNLPPHLSYFT
jgi:hypothetical protein